MNPNYTFQLRVILPILLIVVMFYIPFVCLGIIYPEMILFDLVGYSILITSVTLSLSHLYIDLLEYLFKKRKSIDTPEITIPINDSPTEQTESNVELFGKDHLSLLLYVESRCVDHQGVLDITHIRVNSTKHPLFSGWLYGERPAWTDKNGTRLKTGESLPDHDDINCLDDLDAAGLIEIISLVNGFMKMTEKGNELVSKIRTFKVNGGQLKDFSIETENE